MPNARSNLSPDPCAVLSRFAPKDALIWVWRKHRCHRCVSWSHIQKCIPQLTNVTGCYSCMIVFFVLTSVVWRIILKCRNRLVLGAPVAWPISASYRSSASKPKSKNWPFSSIRTLEAVLYDWKRKYTRIKFVKSNWTAYCDTCYKHGANRCWPYLSKKIYLPGSRDFRPNSCSWLYLAALMKNWRHTRWKLCQNRWHKPLQNPFVWP